MRAGRRDKVASLMARGIRSLGYATKTARATSVTLVALCISAVACPSNAQSESTTDETRALELFDSAASAFREGRFRDALRLLDEADRLHPSGILHYNKARAFEGLGERERAIVEYARYLEMEPQAEDRKAVESRITVLRGEIAERAQLEREKREALERAREKEERPRESTPPPGRPSPWPWIVAGVGVAGLGVGTYFGFRAKSEEDAGETAPSQTEAASDRSRAQTAARNANISWAIGGALVVVGVSWGVIDLQSTNARGAFRGIRLGGTF